MFLNSFSRSNESNFLHKIGLLKRFFCVYLFRQCFVSTWRKKMGNKPPVEKEEVAT